MRAQKLMYDVRVGVGATKNPHTLTVCSSAISLTMLILISYNIVNLNLPEVHTNFACIDNQEFI